MTRARPWLVCALLIFCAGCASPVKMATMGLTEVKGAESQVSAIRDISPAEIVRHNSVRVEQVASDIGHLVPSEFVAATQNALRDKLANLRGLSSTGSPVNLSARITYYQTGGSVSTLLGKEKMAIMHVSATAADGRSLGEFLVVASSEALRTTDMDLANALANGTASHFQKKITP